jgi:hypothetical protein
MAGELDAEPWSEGSWRGATAVERSGSVVTRQREPRLAPPDTGYSQNGRSSNVPILAVGCRDETSIASSRSTQSRTL